MARFAASRRSGPGDRSGLPDLLRPRVDGEACPGSSPHQSWTAEEQVVRLVQLL